jgi:hypothetical protein
VLNVGSGEGTSLLELLRLVEAELGRSGEVIAHDERRFDVHRIVLDVGRLRRLVDFRPTPLPEGIARTHAWLRRIAAGPPATPTKATGAQPRSVERRSCTWPRGSTTGAATRTRSTGSAGSTGSASPRTW